jgi:two-component system NtrC family sensor kinase
MRLHPLSLRIKLILSFLVVIILGGILSLIFGDRLVKSTIISLAQTKVKYDLSAAWTVFNERLDDIKDIIKFKANTEVIRNAMKADQRETILRSLNRVKEEYDLDVLTLIDSRGIVIVRTSNPGVVEDDQSRDEIIKSALEKGTAASPQIIPREELIKEGRDLADRAYLEFVDTPKAAPRPENKEDKGFMLKAASSIFDERGNLLGVLYGGVLINRDYKIVDRVKETVYKDEKYKDREIGTATIFQHDLRISTNVKDESGERAIGTRVSKEVNTAVLVKGEPWIDRAFVVNDWYITAYEPIKNIKNEIIGILYVGVLERPYLDLTRKVMNTFILIVSLCVSLLLIMLFFVTSRIINPLNKMVLATQKIARGDLSHKVEVRSRDEIGLLASSFNHMMKDLKTAEDKLIEWGTTLEKKVKDRTKDLREMQAHLIQTEKLASLGKMAAGIAHEINNPLGGILIYSHLLLEDVEKGSPYRENLNKIVREATRCKNIVKELLEFARPKELEMKLTDLNSTVEKSLNIMMHQALFQNIKIVRKYSENIPRIVIDGAQLQQVFMNIILNAVDAMEGKGVLTLATSVDEDRGFLNVEISDNGAGISEEDQKKIFDPFFSTKEVGSGTGLGLSICYGIVKKHDGTIEVRSRIDRGTTFIVKLPIERIAGNG